MMCGFASLRLARISTCSFGIIPFVPPGIGWHTGCLIGKVDWSSFLTVIHLTASRDRPFIAWNENEWLYSILYSCILFILIYSLCSLSLSLTASILYIHSSLIITFFSLFVFALKVLYIALKECILYILYFFILFPIFFLVFFLVF